MKKFKYDGNMLAILAVYGAASTTNTIHRSAEYVMNNGRTIMPANGSTDALDTLLTDVAIRIQLNRSDYDKAVDRYKAIQNWIDRDGSPLKDRVKLLYPQGSMAIGATVASKLKTDEFDLDIVADLDLPENAPPGLPLDILCKAIRGKPGSRYHNMVTRKTRCVTIQYSDGMHLDITPVVRRPDTIERESWIFHDRPEDPGERGYSLIANPYGFAEWFKDTTPADEDFVQFFAARESHYYELTFLLEYAQSEPVPVQEPPFQKSKAVIVLQLLKRWRNLMYDRRPGRRPPSILIAKLVADAANKTSCLSDELRHQTQDMLRVFQWYHERGRCIYAQNPVCPEDILTDRWPGSLDEQNVFIRDLERLVESVQRLTAGCGLDEMQEIMVNLFGEIPARDAVRAFNEEQGKSMREGESRHRPGTGSIALSTGVIGSGKSSLGSRSTPEHTFYGGRRWKKN